MPGVLSFNTLARDKIPSEITPSLAKLVAPHIDSYDFFINYALPKSIAVRSHSHYILNPTLPRAESCHPARPCDAGVSR